MVDQKTKKQIKAAVKKHLPNPNYQIFLFGSRASAQNQRWSDLDIGILGKEKVPGHTLVRIEEELENSRISFKVDVVDFRTVSDQFRNLALRKTITL